MDRCVHQTLVFIDMFSICVLHYALETTSLFTYVSDNEFLKQQISDSEAKVTENK